MRLRPILLLALVVTGAFLDWQLWHRAPAKPPEITIRFVVHDHPAQAVDVEPADFVTQIQAMLAAGKYDTLEAMAQADRQSSALYVSGVPKLSRLYDAVSAYTGNEDCGCGSPPPDETKFAPVQRSVEDWRREFPESLTPRIALAALWIRYAWDGRGSGWGADVTPEQWQKLSERLSEAEQLLIGPELEADPDTFRQLTQIGYLRDWDRERLDALYDTAVQRFPWYMPLYAQHANFIQTKWGGASGELSGFLDSLRRDRQGSPGQLAYSWVSNNILAGEDANALTALAAYDFPSFLKAFQQREEQFGLRVRDWNAIFLMACKARDWTAAHTALLQIKEDWTKDIWGDRESFDAWVAYFHKQSGYS